MISVILPTYNEFDNLKILLPDLVNFFETRRFNYEIIIVDDNSGDGTEELIDSFKNKHLIFINRVNKKGLASAVCDGTDLARGNIIVHMDSDLAHRVEDLHILLSTYSETGYNFIIGSRYCKGSVFVGKPFMNRIASFCGRKIAQAYLGISIDDLSNNFRVFDKKIWNRIRPYLISEGNIMLVQIIYLARLVGANFKEVPIEYVERRLGVSKLNVLVETKNFFRNLRRIKKGIRDE